MEFGKSVRIGSLDVLKYKDTKGNPFIKVSVINNDFSITYGAGSPIFMFIDNDKLEDSESNLLYLMIINAYASATTTEAQLAVDIMDAIKGFMKRCEETVLTTEEEDARNLEHVKLDHDMREEMDNLKKEQHECR